MSYLIFSDFKRLIQTENLNQLISSDSSVLDSAILAAQSEVVSYLRQKYDVLTEFKSFSVWSKSVTYKSGDRVYLDAPAYISTINYTIGTLCIMSGLVYVCNAATTGAFDSNKWNLLGAQYDMFFLKYPQPLFTFEGDYRVSDSVFWKDKVYISKQNTSTYSHAAQLNFGLQQNIPLGNTAPDDRDNGLSYWGPGIAYSITNLDITNIVWTAGDNRNPQLVNYCIDVAAYTVHARIAPRNVPDFRVKRYDDVISWLKNIAKGEDITADIARKEPRQGSRIRYGGNTKNQNSY